MDHLDLVDHLVQVVLLEQVVSQDLPVLQEQVVSQDLLEQVVHQDQVD